MVLVHFVIKLIKENILLLFPGKRHPPPLLCLVQKLKIISFVGKADKMNSLFMCIFQQKPFNIGGSRSNGVLSRGGRNCSPLKPFSTEGKFLILGALLPPTLGFQSP